MKPSVVFWLLVLGADHTWSLMAQPAGTFTATGNMTTARMFHSATLLPNGKVLIAGGWQNLPGAQGCTGQLHVRQYFLECVKLLSSAELYDPLTGTFTPTGNTTGTGLSHTATLLPDGRVLINWGSRAEIYDPAVGTFTVVNGLAPGSGTATLLNNGKVLFTGSPAKLFDPTDGTLVSTGAYAGTSGVLQTATLLPNGKVLLVGNPGCCDNDSRTEVYDPVTGTFSLTAPIFPYSLT